MAVKLSLILVTLLIITHTHQTTAYITLTQIRTLVSLSHSLSTRVALLRSTRGDDEGAHRAQLIANKLQFGLGPRFWPTLFSMGWDYFRNYAWHDTLSFKDAVRVVSDLNELLNSFAELTRSKNDFERSAWVAKNYRHVLRISKSLTGRFRSVFTKSGPLKELVETLQKEMEGDFLADCLEVGFNDLKGVVQILKDLASQYSADEPKQDL